MARVLSLGGLFIIFYTDYYNNLLIQGDSRHTREHWLEWCSTAVLCDVSAVSEAHPLNLTLKCQGELSLSHPAVDQCRKHNIFSKLQSVTRRCPSQSVEKLWTTHTCTQNNGSSLNNSMIIVLSLLEESV